MTELKDITTRSIPEGYKRVTIDYPSKTMWEREGNSWTFYTVDPSVKFNGDPMRVPAEGVVRTIETPKRTEVHEKEPPCSICREVPCICDWEH